MINIGIGIGWAKAIYSVANNIIANFKARVATYPGSIFEAGPCLDTTLEELNAIGLLDNASLVITPNAYNETKLYDVIPNTTLGDMDVVRATTATRVNSAGLIEVVPRNLQTYSNNLTATYYTNSGCTATLVSQAPLNYSGSNLITEDTSNGDHRFYKQNAFISGNSYTVSIFLKMGTQRYVAINADTWSGGNAVYDLQNGIITSSINGTSSIENVGNGWYRCIFTSTSGISTDANTPIQGNNGSTYNDSYLGTSKTWYAANYQIENFATATEYFPTTTRLNIPRIDYTNGSCPSLLVEPQRTNLFTYSEDFSATREWFPSVAGGSTSVQTNNYGISPDGTQNADRIQLALNGGPYADWVKVSTVLTIGQTYTYSIYLKSLTSNCTIYFLGDGTANILKNVTTQWVRYTHTFTATTAYYVPRFLIEAGTSTTADILAWGGQIELGAYATSYIPTVASTVTRNADIISKTGISSLIGQTEGTLFLDVKANITGINQNIELGDGTTTNRLDLRLTAANKIQIVVRQGGVDVQNFTSVFTFQQGENLKIALGYKSNDTVVYVNGVQISSINTGTITGSFSGIFSGLIGGATDLFYSPINKIFLFKTRLSNSELQSLTTL